MKKLLTLRIPATSANLGPGFDCMGIALDLWNTFELYEAEPGHGITVASHGEGTAALPTDKSHLVVRTMVDELTMRTPFDPQRANYHIICHNDVPVGSGLGSSSTATLAGLLFANALLDPDGFQSETGRQRILTRAFDIEGHGDNVAPALLGGMVLVTASDGRVLASQIALPPTQVVVCVPQFHFLTSHARSVLPLHYTRADAVFNIAHALLVVEGLRMGNYDLLADAAADRIHEPYRLPAIPGALQAKDAALSAGAVAVCLSGAGPGLIGFAPTQSPMQSPMQSPDRHTAIGEAMRRAFAEFGLAARYWVLDVTMQGAQVVLG